jgi:hypothetical protein
MGSRADLQTPRRVTEVGAWSLARYTEATKRGQMKRTVVLGALALAAVLVETGASVADGAVAIGLPADVAEDGVSMGYATGLPMDEAKAIAIERCKANGSATSMPLCKVVATFRNQCVALAIDPEVGTPGFGWAVADDGQVAKNQALANCQSIAGETRRGACQLGDYGCDGSAKEAPQK